MDPRPPTPPGSPGTPGPRRDRTPSERAFMVAATGVSAALLGLDPASARPFALLFLAAAAYVLAEPRLAPRWAAMTSRASAALRDLTPRPRFLRSGHGIAGAIGGALIGFGLAFRDGMPGTMSAFYIALGAIALASALLHAPMQRAPEKWRHAAALAGLFTGIIAAVALGWVTVRYGTNTPFFDEYASTLSLAVEFPQMSGAERHEAIFASHNGHRIATTRLATLGYVALTGRLNFHVLALVSCGILAAAALVIALTLRRDGQHQLAKTHAAALAAPFLLVLFQPQYHQLTLWAFSIQHFAVVLFAALSFALLARPSPAAFAGAVVCSLLAAYTFGSGVLVGVVGLGYLVVRRLHARATAWLLIWGAIAAVYFRGLSLDPPNGPQMSALGKAYYLFEFLGSAATLGAFTDFIGGGQADATRYPAALWAARIAGALMLCAFGWLTLRHYWTRNATVFGLLAMTALSAVLAAALRSTHPYSEPFMSRYTLNSCLFAALLAVALLDLHWPALRTWTPAITASAALFCAASFALTVPFARAHAADLRYVMLLTAIGEHAGAPPRKVQLPFYDFALLERARASGVYATPEEFAVSALAAPRVDAPLDDLPVRGNRIPNITYIGESDSAYTFFVAAPESAAQGNAVYLVIESGAAGSLAFAARTPGEHGMHERFFGYNSPPGTTYLACVPKRELPEGRLDIALVLLDGETRKKTPVIATVGPE